MNEENMYTLEHRGLLKVDVFLATACVLILVGELAVFAAVDQIPQHTRMWGSVGVISSIPSLFFMLWHQFRWPVRLHQMSINVDDAVEIFSEKLCHAVRTVAEAKAKESLLGEWGEKIIQGPDGKQYIRGPREKVLEEAVESIIESTDDPIVTDTFSLGAREIYNANRKAAVGLLPEKFPRAKQVMDLCSRYLRYPCFVILLISTVMFLFLWINRP